jgi:hypothetical protein
MSRRCFGDSPDIPAAEPSTKLWRAFRTCFRENVGAPPKGDSGGGGESVGGAEMTRAALSAFGRTTAELNLPDGWATLLAFARVIFARPRVRKCTSADVMIARARRWPAEAAEMWSAIAADFAEATPLPPSETRFAVEDCDLPRGLATRMLDTPAEVAKKSLIY